MKQLILFLTIALGSTVSAQTKYGYIEFEKVKTHFPEYNAGQIEHAGLTKKFNDSISVLIKILEKKMRGHYPQYTLKDSVFLKERVDELNFLQERFKSYHAEGSKFLKSRQEQIDSTLKNLVAIELKKFQQKTMYSAYSTKKQFCIVVAASILQRTLFFTTRKRLILTDLGYSSSQRSLRISIYF